MIRVSRITSHPLCLVLAALAGVCALSLTVVGCASPDTGAADSTTAEVATVDSTTVEPSADDETSSTQTTPWEQPSRGAASNVADDGLFDSSIVHEISVSFSPEDYDAMIQTYRETGEKDWIEATVTIDGETYENVGVRLKGNSSIMGLRQGRMGQVGRNVPAGANGLAEGTGPADATGAPGVNAGQGFDRPAMGPGGDASADIPEGLPWLIDLDKYVDNQNHGGIVELAVRSNVTETALNEAVSVRLLELAGLASQNATYVRFSVNGSEERLRLVLENPDDMWMAEEFDISGALYKAESTGDYSYRGEDPGSYDEVFDQEAGKTNADLTPLIGFLDFINNSDEAVFNAGLPDRLDIESFATYLAVQELIANADDIDGLGNNSYLYYDTRTEKFTVVAWDHNLAFGGMGRAGGLGGVDGAAQDGAQLPGVRQNGDRIQDRGQPRARSNVLVERFQANPEWQQLYENRLSELKTELYGSGQAAAVLDTWVALLKTRAADLVDPTTVDEEAASVSRYFSAE